MLCLLSCLALASPAMARAQTPQLTPLWVAPGFADPESVALSSDRKFLYVANVDGEGDAKDGKGYIAKLSLDGAVLDGLWATGFDAPKGLSLRGKRLFLSDITALVELDSRSGKLIARHEAADAGFLNDVAFAPDGSVLVSDSANSRIYALRDGRLEVWLQDPQLDSVNGLLAEDARLVISTMQGKLLALDWTTRKITLLAQGLGDGDGVAALGDGSYLVSEWPGRLFHVKADGSNEVLLDQRQQKRYINDFLLVGDRLFIPNWKPGSVSAYRLQK